MRIQGSLSPEVLYRIRKHFRIKNIYHSNAIEGNVLAVGETRQVVEHGLSVAGKPQKDQVEARNLSRALDYLEDLAGNHRAPITEIDVRHIHTLVLEGLSDGAGVYRSVPVTITGSEHTPSGPESVPGQMEEFGQWLSHESVQVADHFAEVSDLLASAVTHTWFVTVHPFIDGNGRVARLLLNLMLMRSGFPIAIITKDDRIRYYDALEASHASGISRTCDLTPFIELVAESIEESLEEYEAAAKEQRDQTEWATSLAERFAQTERISVENEYVVWKNAMGLLKSYFQQPVQIFKQFLSNQVGPDTKLDLKDFGTLEFEKYSSLRSGDSAKRVWFLRVDFQRGDISARYLFSFGHASYAMQGRCDVTLQVAREEPPDSFHYESIEHIRPTDTPQLAEIGYEVSKERFVVRMRSGRPRKMGVKAFTNQFFEDVISIHFDV